MYAFAAVCDTDIMSRLMAKVVGHTTLVVLVELSVNEPVAWIIVVVTAVALFLCQLGVDRMVVDVIKGFLDGHSCCKLREN